MKLAPLWIMLVVQIGFGLDQERVRQLYIQGEFDQLNQYLSQELDSAQNLTRADSMVILSHLGIVNGSFEEDRFKGEGYLYTLFKLNDNYQFKQMLLSRDLEDWVEVVRERFRQDWKGPFEKPPQKEAEKKTEPIAPERKPTSWGWWVAGGTGVAALVTWLIWLNSNQEPEKQTHTLSL